MRTRIPNAPKATTKNFVLFETPAIAPRMTTGRMVLKAAAVIRPDSGDQLRKQLASRPATYLVGELDTLPLAGFDSSCPAMAQGANRLARGQAFANYVNRKYNAQQKLMVVPLSGHNARCMFTTEQVLPILFPKLQ